MNIGHEIKGQFLGGFSSKKKGTSEATTFTGAMERRGVACLFFFLDWTGGLFPIWFF